MCGDKAQRILMAVMLGISMALIAYPQTIKVGVILQTFIIIMLFIFAFTNFCPSLWFFNKLFGKCKWDK
jgi:hypothetical protein